MILNCKLSSNNLYSHPVIILVTVLGNRLGIVFQKRFGTLWKEDLVKVFGGLLMEEVLLLTKDG